MATQNITLQSCARLIRDIPDFPKKGITFKDISPLLQSGPHFRLVVDELANTIEEKSIPVDILAGPEARGFIFGAALAYRLGVGFVPIRKPGKLPYRTREVEYDLEYGTDRVEMHVDAVTEGQNVLIVDDLLATGGTTAACAKLLSNVGARVSACVFLVELDFLEGRARLIDYPTHSLLHF